MNEMEQWLYSGSEDVYLKSALDEKVKDLNELGNKVYKRYHDWELLSESLNRLHNEVDKKQVQVNDSSQNTFLKPGDREEMTKLIHQNLNLHKEGSAKFEKGSRLADPPLAYQEVDKAIDEFSKVRLFFTQKFLGIIQGAEKREKDELKRKEEEEKKKKEADKKAEKPDVNMTDSSQQSPADKDNTRMDID